MANDLAQRPVLEARIETQPEDSMLTLIERMASNPNVDIVKLERLIEMRRQAQADQAKVAFACAFSAMQAELPTIIERKKTNNGKYAPLEDIIEVVRPILQKHGFALSHETQWPDAKTVEVVGVLTHRDGHERRSTFRSEPDDSGNKNDIQMLGSAMSYGRRYTVNDLLCIVSRNLDDDGARSARVDGPAAPKGYDDWLMDFESTAEAGTEALKSAWKQSKQEYCRFLTTTAPKRHEAIKRRAVEVDQKAAAQ